MYRYFRNLVLESIENSEVAITVQDDVVGFATDELNGDKPFGLTGMKERAAVVNGKLDIASHPGSGTKVQLAGQTVRLAATQPAISRHRFAKLGRFWLFSSSAPVSRAPQLSA